jgi:hypothetical protein
VTLLEQDLNRVAINQALIEQLAAVIESLNTAVLRLYNGNREAPFTLFYLLYSGAPKAFGASVRVELAGCPLYLLY